MPKSLRGGVASHPAGKLVKLMKQTAQSSKQLKGFRRSLKQVRCTSLLPPQAHTSSKNKPSCLEEAQISQFKRNRQQLAPHLSQIRRARRGACKRLQPLQLLRRGWTFCKKCSTSWVLSFCELSPVLGWALVMQLSESFLLQ